MLGSVVMAPARSRWNRPADSWEEVQERVRGLLTTPKAVRRLLFVSSVLLHTRTLSQDSNIHTLIHDVQCDVCVTRYYFCA